MAIIQPNLFSWDCVDVRSDLDRLDESFSKKRLAAGKPPARVP
jgi:hypothetical protein